MYDLIIKNGVVVDGVKTTQYRADVGIRGDRIVQIGALGDAEASRMLDATGKIVAPGFVDVHNHSDAWLLKQPTLAAKTAQGFTTEVIMADGISYAPVNAQTAPEWLYYLRALNGLRLADYTGWQTIADYLDRLDGKTLQNFIAHIPYANVRTLACGWGRQPPDNYQMSAIRAEVEAGMAAGAVGLSSGLDYIAQCFASTDELADACQPLAAEQGLYVTHMRYKIGVLPALREAVAIGRRAGIPVHISHLKATSAQDSDEILNYIDKVAVNEVDFSFDVYPYLPGSTMLNYLLPYEVWEDGPLAVLPRLRRPEVRARFGQSLAEVDLETVHIAWVQSKENSGQQGRTLADYIADSGLSAADALCNLLIDENLAVLLVFDEATELAESDKLLAPFLSHRLYMMGSDGIYHEDGVIHPRQYGSAARLLGRCVRQQQLLSLEEAVFKLSGYPAARFGLRNRGFLRAGAFADLVVFDATTITDRATFRAPHQLAAGVDHVFVNGVSVIEDGQPVASFAGPMPGRALHFRRAR